MIKQIAKLYKLSTTGKAQEWTIEVEGNKYRTIAGQVNGKLTTSEWTKCEGKNIGQSNETTPEEQAVKEAEAKAKKKRESGYTDNLKDAGRADYFEPMLAHKWEDHADAMSYPFSVQPKLDGIRCVISKDGMFSRNGKPIVSAPHIFNSLKQFFVLHPNVVLDGELYNHNLNSDFNKIVSLVKKTKPTSEDLLESESMIEYHCYDMCDLDEPNLIFADRYEFLKENRISNYEHVVMVKTLIVENNKECDKVYEQFMEFGFEGMIVRSQFGKYEHKRSKNLLKRKEFVDEEYVILDIVEGEGNRTGTAGYMVFENKDGKRFKSNIKGDYLYLADILKNKQNLIGEKATIKYFNLTPDGVPRFPFVTSIRNYE